MTEKLDLEDLYNDFDSLPEQEDTVDLSEVKVPDDDYFEQTEEVAEHPTYGDIPEVQYATYDYPLSDGKTLQVYHEKMGTLWAIKFKEGGQVAQELQSKFTNEGDARQAVELYLAAR